VITNKTKLIRSYLGVVRQMAAPNISTARVGSSTEITELLPKAFYSPSEVADLASVSSSTILNYIHEGRLTAVHLSERTYRIPRKAVIRLLELESPGPVTVDDPTGSVTF
jgi:excisionase family DNA binding protein